MVTLLASGLAIAINRFRRSGSATVGASNVSPTVFTYDGWQAAPLIIVSAFGFYVGVYGVAVVAFAFMKHPPSMTLAVSVILVLAGVLLSGLSLFAGTGVVTCVIRMILPDHLYIGPEGLGLYSLGKTQQWTWSQVSDVQMRSIQTARGGTVRYNVVVIAGDKPRYVRLTNCWKSSEGPQTVESIYALIKRRLPHVEASATNHLVA